MVSKLTVSLRLLSLLAIVNAAHNLSAAEMRTARIKSTPLAGHTDWVNSANFSPDGRLIVTASWDHTARVWRDTHVQQQERALALVLASAQHPRLGADSPAQSLDRLTAQLIASFGLADSFSK